MRALLLAFAFPLTAAAQSARWNFTATLDTTSEALAVEACSAGPFEMIRFEAGSGAASARTQVARGAGGELQIDDDALMAADWQAGECLHTRIDLAAAARAQGQRFGYQPGQYVVLAPERWLWRPMRVEPDSEIRLELPEGWSASVPWPPVPGKPGAHRLGPTGADWPALSAFGRFEEQRFELPGGQLRIALLPPWSGRERARIEPVARALAAAYGRLPRSDAQILVVPIPGSREAAPWGQATRGGGSAVHLFVGADAAEDALIEDWTATHEFSHLLHPYFGSRGRWLGEGLASYYQNVLRARIGALSADEAWDKIAAGFERGRRETKSDGMTLEQASRRMGALRAYMRTYWSGAAYWAGIGSRAARRGRQPRCRAARLRAMLLRRRSGPEPGGFRRGPGSRRPARRLRATLPSLRRADGLSGNRGAARRSRRGDHAPLISVRCPSRARPWAASAGRCRRCRWPRG